MLAGDEAPKTTECKPCRLHTQSIASAGGMAPEANADIAITLQRLDPMTLQYAPMPPHMRNPILLTFVQMIGLWIPT